MDTNLTDTPWVEVVTELSDSMEEPAAQFAKLIRRASGSQSANRGRDIGLFDAKRSPSFVNTIPTKDKEVIIFQRRNKLDTLSDCLKHSYLSLSVRLRFSGVNNVPRIDKYN